MIAAAVAVLVTLVLMSRRICGFHIGVAGETPRAARFAGVVPGWVVAFCFRLAGGLRVSPAFSRWRGRPE